MAKDRVIEALTPAVAAGDPGVAYEQLTRVEWLLRGRARRILAGALTDAAHRAGEAGLGHDPATVQHVLRVASLQLRGLGGVDLGNRDEVLRAYDSSAPPAPRARFPLATVAASAVALAVAGLLGWQLTRAPGAAPLPPPPPPRPVVAAAPDFSTPLPRRVMPAPSASAYTSGGVPLPEPLLEKAFADTLPHLVVATDAVAHGRKDAADERKRLEAELHAPELLAALGPRAAARWNDLLATLAEISRMKPEGERFTNAAMRLHDAAGLLDDELARAGLAYQVDADTWGGQTAGHAAFYLYKVEEVLFVQGGAEPTRVLVVRRLDKLNVTRAALGMQAEYLRDPLVLRQELEAHAVTRVLPAIDAEKPLKLGDPEWNQSDDGRAVAKAAGEVARAEMNGPLGADVIRARVVGVLLFDRENTVSSWRQQAAGHFRIGRVETALLPAELFMGLRGTVDDASLQYGGKLDVRLAELDVEGVVARVADLLTPSVARHEAQHGRDDARDAPLGLPAALAEILGPERDEQNRPNHLATSAKYELSAYLAQIASNPELARLDLILLSHYAFDRQEWGRAESFVAAFVVAEIARELGVPLDGPVIHDRQIDRARLGKALRATLVHSTAEVQAAAARAWAALFGEPLVVLR